MSELSERLTRALEELEAASDLVAGMPNANELHSLIFKATLALESVQSAATFEPPQTNRVHGPSVGRKRGN